jgi:hypothetical protein
MAREGIGLKNGPPAEPRLREPGDVSKRVSDSAWWGRGIVRRFEYRILLGLGGKRRVGARLLGCLCSWLRGSGGLCKLIAPLPRAFQLRRRSHAGLVRALAGAAGKPARAAETGARLKGRSPRTKAGRCLRTHPSAHHDLACRHFRPRTADGRNHRPAKFERRELECRSGHLLGSIRRRCGQDFC